ncbi:MAG: ABC transporter permease [Acidobacteriota bacterium]
MSKLLAVMKREYLERVRKRSFIILTLAGPLLLAAIYSLPVLFLSMSGTEKHLGVVDLHGGLIEPFVAQLAEAGRLKTGETSSDLPADGETADGGFELAKTLFSITDAGQTGDTIATARLRLNQDLAAGRFDAYLILGEDPDETGSILYGSRSSGDIPDSIERALREPLVAVRASDLGLTLGAAQIVDLARAVEVTPIRVNSKGEETSEGAGQQAALIISVWVLAFFFYIIFILWGSNILRGIIEEKTSRIVEVLLSSVTPTQFMVGKVAGIGCVALTQIVVWGACGFILTLTGAAAAPQVGQLLAGINPMLFLWFVLLFLLGFAMYAVIYAAVGSTVTSTQEAEQAAGPITLTIVASFMAMVAVQRAPDSGLAVAVSLFPLTAPLNLLMRLGISDPPAWQIGLSLLLQVGAIAGLGWAAARVFRVGTLMYGKRATIPEIFKWVRSGA